MSKKTLREISYEYARERGGGLPLTAEELCNCVVLWVQQYVEETPAKIVLKAEDIVGLIEGSETVVVDLNEAGNAIEIHLDGDVVNKIDRAILQPISNPIEDSVPVVRSYGGVAYEKLSDIATPLFLHRITFSNNPVVLSIVTTDNIPFTTNNISTLKYKCLIGKYGTNTTDLEGFTILEFSYTQSTNVLKVYYYHPEYPVNEHVSVSLTMTNITDHITKL